MKVCFVSSYYSKNYVRGSFLLDTLKMIDGVDLYVARNSSTGFKKYFETISEVIKIRLKDDPDIYLVSFRGHEILPIVKLIAIGKVVIFDTLVSPYHALNDENKFGLLGKLISYLIYPLEFIILHLSDLILTDTELHKEFYNETFKVNEAKIERVFVGSQSLDLDLPEYSPGSNNEPLSIFFYGNFLPLHGIKYILESAKDLKDEDVKFTLVGGGEKAERELHRFAEINGLKNIEHIKWLDLNNLFIKARSSNICLGGPFGGTDQALRVITGKTYQFLNMGIPTIIGRINEEVGFIDKDNCLLVDQADSSQLSDAILWCKNNRDQLSLIGSKGKELYEGKFSNKAQKETVLNILKRYE